MPLPLASECRRFPLGVSAATVPEPSGIRSKRWILNREHPRKSLHTSYIKRVRPPRGFRNVLRRCHAADHCAEGLNPECSLSYPCVSSVFFALMTSSGVRRKQNLGTSSRRS